MTGKKRGRPPIPFDHSIYGTKRLYREMDKQRDQHLREIGKLKAGRPKGLLVDLNHVSPTYVERRTIYGEQIFAIQFQKRPLIIEAGRLVLEVKVRLDKAQKKGELLTRKEATFLTLRRILGLYGKKNMAECLLDTALHLIRDYRKKRPWEFPPAKSGD